MDALVHGSMISGGSGSGWEVDGNDGDGIWGSGDEYDVSGKGGGDGNGSVAATAAISALV
ncbi:hypothetical protein Tco_0552579, partial [Tanacetum coccineum]